MRKRHPRLLAPLATLMAGTVVAAAVAIGHTWAGAIATEIVTLIVSGIYYLVTGSDSDIGAIYRQRTDERQRQVRLEAVRLAFSAMMIAAFVIAVIMVALGDQYWQEDVLWCVGGFTFLFGLAHYGEHEPRELSTTGIMGTDHSSERSRNSESHFED
jgi:peptidoglycan/LPS O-acetylase OafA/YrhL